MHDCFGHSSAMMESSEPANSEFSMTICGDERGLRADFCLAWTWTACAASAVSKKVVEHLLK